MLLMAPTAVLLLLVAASWSIRRRHRDHDKIDSMIAKNSYANRIRGGVGMEKADHTVLNTLKHLPVDLTQRIITIRHSRSEW